MIKINGIDYLTVSETAERLAVNKATILKMLNDKRLNGFKHASRFLIDPKEIDRYIEELKNR